MFRLCVFLQMTVHSPRGIPFRLHAGDAIARVKSKYGSRWLGASEEYLDLTAPSAEFLPFYYCQGTINGSFRGIVSYNETTTDEKGSSRSTSREVMTDPQPINSSFGTNHTQIYAGYKYNIRHVHTTLRREENPMHLRKMNAIDVSHAKINLFEQSTTTLRLFVHEEVKRQAEETARALIRSFHPGASTISVEFLQLNIKLEEVTPVFVPCYVVNVQYDMQTYTVYVNAIDGEVGGPFLLNALLIGRLSAVSCAALALLFVPNKLTGLFFGSLAAVPVYYAAYYAAKLFPSHRRDYFRTQRQRLRSQHETKDRSGFRPEMGSQRVKEEYRRSSYKESHAFESRKPHRGPVRDPRGYYRTLGLNGTESVNEIRSAFRKLVLLEHPDAGGSAERMSKINEAYRVLRDPKRREKYDAE